MTIKNIEDLKNIQIVCRKEKDVEKCSKMLRELWSETTFYDKYKVFLYSSLFNNFTNQMELRFDLDTYFFNKKLIKTLQKFIKQKEEKEKEKEEVKTKDFKVAEDGRIIKINNWDSQQKIYIIDGNEKEIYDVNFSVESYNKTINLGLIYATKEARDKAMFKLEIETKLKNIAERLNKGQKIDWENRNQSKCRIYYDYNYKKIDWVYTSFKTQGLIYCLDENFLNVAKQEIGENDLIKYFKEDFN